MAYVPLDCRFPHTPEAPAWARRSTQVWLSDRGVCAEVVDDAVIVVSELVANGVLHGGDADIGVRVDIDGDDIFIVVTTAAPAPGTPTARREPGETGRGLAMVAACCKRVEVARGVSGERSTRCRIAMRHGSGEGTRPSGKVQAQR